MHRTTPSTLKTLAPSAATPSPGLRPPSPQGRGCNKLQFTLPSPPSGERGLGEGDWGEGDRLGDRSTHWVLLLATWYQNSNWTPATAVAPGGRNPLSKYVRLRKLSTFAWKRTPLNSESERR